MNREKILKEIDEAMAELKDVKEKVNEISTKLFGISNIVTKDDSEAYNKGLEDAWKFVKKIRMGRISFKMAKDVYNMDIDGLSGSEIIDRILDMSPQEALAKLEAYEKEQKEIKVGDVVSVNGDIGIVTSFGTDNERIHILYDDGIVNSYMKDNKSIKKTGKHIDISSILKQIGGDE